MQLLNCLSYLRLYDRDSERQVLKMQIVPPNGQLRRTGYKIRRWILVAIQTDAILVVGVVSS
jgi:hypothetical protein